MYTWNQQCVLQCQKYYNLQKFCVDHCSDELDDIFISASNTKACTRSCESTYYWVDDDDYICLLQPCGGQNVSGNQSSISGSMARCESNCSLFDDMPYQYGGKCLTQCEQYTYSDPTYMCWTKCPSTYSFYQNSTCVAACQSLIYNESNICVESCPNGKLKTGENSQKFCQYFNY